MASPTAYKLPGTTANVDRDGQAAWTNTDYVKADDTSYATCQPGKTAGTYGDWLVVTNFGFTSTDIPAGNQPVGLQLIINVSANYTNAITDSALYFYNNGQVGSNLASGSYYPMRGNEADRLYGGATNMCGTTVTRNDVLSSNFGVMLSIVDNVGDKYANIDYIKIRVYYTEGGGSPVFLPNIMKHNFIPPLIGGY